MKADKIWFDGELIDWDKATIHVLSHVVHYGTSAFEGIRCYDTKNGPAIFRLRDHVKRLFESCKIYRMEIPYTIEEIEEAIIKTIKANNLKACYIRPLVFRGFSTLGLNPLPCPIQVIVAAWEWGSYLGEDGIENGISARISSWNRPAPNTFPTMAKMGGQYLNSQLMKLEAMQDGFDEAISLNVLGFISEGSGENLFLVRNGVMYTPPTSACILPGITRHCVFKIAESFNIKVTSHQIPREALYVADEVFLTGTAAEITPISSLDRIPIGNGGRGPITKKIQDEYFGIINGEIEDKYGWMTYID